MHYENSIIRKSLNFTFFQMLDVHRQPFLLQLFASAAPLLAVSSFRVNSASDYSSLLFLVHLFANAFAGLFLLQNFFNNLKTKKWLPTKLDK